MRKCLGDLTDLIVKICERSVLMGVATTVRDATNIERANENETRREMIAS
mgnify:CR=1 FL=1